MVHSSGIAVFRTRNSVVEVLLVHPGGPFWGRKDSWSIPKGELEADEDLVAGAKREFLEEIGLDVPAGDLLPLGEAKQGGKTNHIWAVEGEVDLNHFAEARAGNMVKMDWPPRSGKQIEFAENDRAEWFDLATARQKVFKNQIGFIERLAEHLHMDLDEITGTSSEGPVQQSLL